MKLWHDDVRKPPPGWEWARTNDEAKEYLSIPGLVTEISLDYDLGLHTEEEIPEPGDDEYWDRVISITYALQEEGAPTGLDLVEWMIEQGCVPQKITVHSWNPDGAMRMAQRLAADGHDVVVSPYAPRQKENKDDAEGASG